MNTAYQFSHYLLKRQVLALTGKIRVYDPSGNLILFSEQKMFKLKEDIRVYDNEFKSQELLYIKARNILDFSAAYDIFDSVENTKIGTLRRKGVRSLVRDEWEILDTQDQLIGSFYEDNMTQALLRRLLLGNLLPQNYDMQIGSSRVADIRQRFNLIRYELEIDFSPNIAKTLDPRVGISAGILLAIIEGRQE